MKGTKQEATENITKWARKLKIEKKVKWIGKPKEEKRKKERNRQEKYRRQNCRMDTRPGSRIPMGKKKGQRGNGNTRTVPKYGRDNVWKY